MSTRILFLLVLMVAALDAAPVKRSIDDLLQNAKQKFRSRHPGVHKNHDGGRRTEIDIIVKKDEGRSARNALRDMNTRWKGNVVNYEIPGRIFSARSDVSDLKKAMAEWQSETCLTFKDVGSQAVDKIQFVREDGCWSWVGRTGGTQKVSIGDGCMHHTVIIHEVGHALGFHHEQTRPDRDNYVTIKLDKVDKNLRHNFDKYDTSYINDYSVPYDYRSCMHYGPTAFSSDGSITIKTTDPDYQDVIGQYTKVSFRDVKLVNAMYQCAKHCPKITCPGEGFLDKDCKCRCAATPTKACSPVPGSTAAPTAGPTATKPPTRGTSRPPTRGSTGGTSGPPPTRGTSPPSSTSIPPRTTGFETGTTGTGGTTWSWWSSGTGGTTWSWWSPGTGGTTWWWWWSYTYSPWSGGGSGGGGSGGGGWSGGGSGGGWSGGGSGGSGSGMQ